MRTPVAALLAFATLTAMSAAADVVWLEDDVVWPGTVLDNRHRRLDYLDRDDSRIDEVFPVKHRCSEVPVLIHAQRRTMKRMIESCTALKWTADRFHALMQTDPADAVADVNSYGYLTTVMEMFVLDRDDAEYRDYLDEFWSSDHAGFYINGISVVSESQDGSTILPTEVHEFVHNLQFDGFVSGYLGGRLGIWIEGFASFIEFEYVRSELRGHWYGPSWTYEHISWENVEQNEVGPSLQDLPHLTAFVDPNSDQWQDLLTVYSSRQVEYFWGAWVFRFLAERHPAELVSLKEIINDLRDGITFDLWSEIGTRIHDLLARLNDDWRTWHEAPLSVADDAGSTVLTVPLIPEGPYSTQGYVADLSYFFRTFKELDFDVSPIDEISTNDSQQNRPPIVSTLHKSVYIFPRSVGIWEFTITATSMDGESAELPFTVKVVERLESSEIVIRDPLSTEEGRTVVYLNQYFNGPEDIAFTAESANSEVATATVTADGWLVLTAISPGEAEVTVRATSGQQNAERTFTVVVNDECPPWLCRDFLSGWRKALLL